MYLSACEGESASSFLPANATKLIIELLIQKADPSNWAYKTGKFKKKKRPKNGISFQNNK